MSEINLSSLDPRYGAHIDKAVRAIENGNPTYAIDVWSAFLHKHPNQLFYTILNSYIMIFG